MSVFTFRNRNRAPHRNSNRTPAPVRNNNEDEELNCPTCKNRYTLTIFQCQRGHSSCVFCKNSSAPCGVCGLPITNMRNITLEAYIGEVRIINITCLLKKKHVNSKRRPTVVLSVYQPLFKSPHSS